ASVELSAERTGAMPGPGWITSTLSFAGRFPCSRAFTRGAAKHALEDGVDIAQLTLQAESLRQLLRGESLGDLLVAVDELAKVQAFLPRAHGVLLRQAICVLA